MYETVLNNVYEKEDEESLHKKNRNKPFWSRHLNVIKEFNSGNAQNQQSIFIVHSCAAAPAVPQYF